MASKTSGATAVVLNLTAAAEVDGNKFDGVDLFLADPHISIDISDDGIKELADKIGGMGLAIGSLVAPVWSGSTLGGPEKEQEFLTQVEKACRIGAKLKERSARP